VPRVNLVRCWADIERWLSANAPDMVPLLPVGASPAAFAAAEETLGYALPRELKGFLAVHDGSGRLWLHDRGEFMSLGTILASWDQEFDLWGDGDNDEAAAPRGPIRKRWFTRRWLPVLDARTGDYVCIDLDPPKGGKRGQPITWYHDNGPTEVIAPSFAALVSGFVADLAGGLYTPKVSQAGQPYLDYAPKRA
jgi:cell wall assembly regulator SMI1